MKGAKGLLAVGATVAALALMVLVNPVPGYAQSGALIVKIPFDFHVGSKGLPAGSYTVEKRGDAIWINDGKGNNAAVLTDAVENRAFNKGNMLLFRRYHDQYFLSEARWSEYKSARGLVRSTSEAKVAANTKSEVVMIAAVLK